MIAPAHRNTSHLRVLHVAVECVPFATTGGLGDVLGALPGVQRSQGCDARILLPRYGFIADELVSDRIVATLALRDCTAIIREAATDAAAAPVYFCEIAGIFDRGVDPYRDDSGQEFSDNPHRFMRFCEAAARFAAQGEAFSPQIVHAHDWHAGSVAAWLQQLQWPGQTAFSIHNLAYQGLSAPEVFSDSGLAPSYWSKGATGYDERWSPMKVGITCSDAVTTVSPSYAREIQTPEDGCGLHASLQEAAARGALHGIVNGIDERAWDPQYDVRIHRGYSIADVAEGKRLNRRYLQVALGLEVEDRPLLAFVGRLTHQKGADLLAEVLPFVLERPVQIVIVGVGETDLERRLTQIAAPATQQIAFCPVYDPLLVRQVMAAADLLLMPSRFEPCGLTQLYAQRYGTIPVVRRTGGLQDTVVDATPQTLADATATGVLFNDADADGLRYGIQRALTLIEDPDVLRRLRGSGMGREFSWRYAAQAYLELYSALHEQGGAVEEERPPSASALKRSPEWLGITQMRQEAA